MKRLLQVHQPRLNVSRIATYNEEKESTKREEEEESRCLVSAGFCILMPRGGLRSCNAAEMEGYQVSEAKNDVYYAWAARKAEQVHQDVSSCFSSHS